MDRLPALGLAVLAVAACCAGLPLLVAGIASIGLGAAFGLGAGVLAAVAAVVALTGIVRARRRRCAQGRARERAGA